MSKAAQTQGHVGIRLIQTTLISLLSVFLPTLSIANSVPVQLEPSKWGGKGIYMVVKETRVAFEFDCAFGAIAHPLPVDSQGTFSSPGTYSLEPGGPMKEGDPPMRDYQATYSGWTDHSKMELRITLKEGGRVVGPFTLEVNRDPNLEKCY